MANIVDCPGFESFGADVKAARKAKHLSRKMMAEIINIDPRYLANIENDSTIPSLPVIIQLIKVCGLPVERYFNPEVIREESAQRQRISHKLKPVYDRYKASKDKEKFLRGFESEIIFFEAAVREIKRAGLTKLPSAKS